mmetsp:Transcript_115535/g.326592  ORF Transcript_115535/g.326592 Transcript_115535/m.326592 type:complete len:123 (-) Transcript_115535:121-489(-)
MATPTAPQRRHRRNLQSRCDSLWRGWRSKRRPVGSRFMIGNSLSALDIYFATALFFFCPAGPDMIPITEENKGMLKQLAINPPEVQGILDSTTLFVEHREYILKTYCVTPAVLGGTPMSLKL